MQSIVVVGRRWRDMYGNTYHTSEIACDGEFVGKTDREYGYGSQYVWTAFAWLERSGRLTREGESPYRWSERNGVSLACTACDVPRRGDL